MFVSWATDSAGVLSISYAPRKADAYEPEVDSVRLSNGTLKPYIAKCYKADADADHPNDPMDC